MTSPLPRILALLLFLNAVGYAVALATDLVDPLPGFLNGSKTHAPLVIWGAQSLGISLLLRGRRAGGFLALLACSVSLAAVAFDGDLGSAGLGTGHVALQIAIATATAALWATLAATLTRRGMVARWGATA
jgi:hypothetical protein